MQEKHHVRDLYIADASEFEEGDCRVVVRQGLEIGVYRVEGDFYAYENLCPHQGGPVCRGKVIKKVEELLGQNRTSLGLTYSEEQTHIVCPWHGYEYNVKTGIHPGDSTVRLRKFKVEERDGAVYVIV